MRKFNGAVHARRYVYAILVSMIDAEFHAPANREGWMFGGIEDPGDRRALTRALRTVQRKLLKHSRVP